MKTQKVKLIEVVEPIRGNSAYTKEYGEKNKGEYPVYSASNNLPLTNINHYDYDGEYLTWATNGFGGFLKVLSGKFSVNGDRGVLVPKKGMDIDMSYLRYTLQPILRDLAKGRRGDRGKNEFTKVPIATIKKVSIDIPVEADGRFDVEKQLVLADKYRVTESLRTYLKAQISELSDTVIDVPIESDSMVLKIGEIFDFDQRTNGSHFTKQFVDMHKGEIPVFSASKDDQAVTYGYVKDGLSGIQYFEDILTWNIDGSVGKAFFRKGRFTLSEKVIPLIFRKEWEGLIDYNFVKYLLEEKAVENGFGFSNKAGKSRIKDIEISIPRVRVGDTWIPDLDTQKRLVDRYREAYALKYDFITQLEELEALSVSF